MVRHLAQVGADEGAQRARRLGLRHVAALVREQPHVERTAQVDAMAERHAVDVRAGQAAPARQRGQRAREWHGHAPHAQQADALGPAHADAARHREAGRAERRAAAQDARLVHAGPEGHDGRGQGQQERDGAAHGAILGPATIRRLETEQYTVAVRTLCEFAAQEGDLDLRFTPAPTAREGIEGHALVAARRGAGWQAELALEGRHEALLLRGRADLWHAARSRLEEVKTHRGDAARVPANHRALHWAQLKAYGALACRRFGLAEITLGLVYLDVGTQRETVLEEKHAASALEAFLAGLCERFLAWARREVAHRAARDAALAALAFPHGAFRAGQRELAAAVWRAAAQARPLMAQAPTGIGKTVGTLFPLLKAAPAQRLDKIAFLTAKGSGRGLALDALATLRGGGAVPLRVLELTAREAACEHPDKACHGESCPLAAGFYDRLPAARAAAFEEGAPALDRARVREVALAHGVCPYWLAQALVRWADAWVGDYNHWFDLSAALHGHAQAEGWRVGVLADEAHNLVERARAMYSAALDQRALDAVRRAAPAALKAPLDRLHRAWNALHQGQDAGCAVLAEGVPPPFAEALARAAAALAEHLAEVPQGLQGELLPWHFDALHFLRVLERYDAVHSMVDLAVAPERGKARSTLTIRNLVPAPHLAPRFTAAHTATIFSATLSPPAFHRELLGLPEDTPFVDVASPFGPEQLQVRIARRVSTRYADRARSIGPIVETLARQYAEAPGNYLAFFSSFEYLAQALAAFSAAHPEVPVWAQARGMAASEREAFLARFTEDGRGIGFAVLGGSFGEGVDLPGRRLVGAFIATLGLPPPNEVNEQTRARVGYDNAYLYPGLTKVVQAAGRVVRTETDRGVVWLIDDRYARPAVRRLLPAWWSVTA